MPITKKQKGEMLEGLKENIKKSDIVMFVNFHGLSVNLSSQLRRALKKIGTGYLVAKKTLIRKALESMGMAGEMPNLEGEVAMAYSSVEPLSSAKELHQFAKKNKIFKILGGIFEKRFIAKERVLELANIPPRNELLGRLVGSIYSPVSSFVRVLDKIKESKVS